MLCSNWIDLFPVNRFERDLYITIILLFYNNSYLEILMQSKELCFVLLSSYITLNNWPQPENPNPTNFYIDAVTCYQLVYNEF